MGWIPRLPRWMVRIAPTPSLRTLRRTVCCCRTALSAFRCRFFFKHTSTTEIYTLPLHDALPISAQQLVCFAQEGGSWDPFTWNEYEQFYSDRSEEHTSELQSRQYLVCRLLL